ncbi:MAG: ATP-dependent Clp protease adapter ClpS [Oligoflexia bacterium]|nr:ATP-dependent Clp protease adapter ClpS [Oligoflexia bacterium]
MSTEGGVKSLTRKKAALKQPKLYRVLMLNDDYTTMDFVVSVLESVFNKTPAEAVQIMLSVHQKGSGMCGVFTKEIAEAKIDQVHKRARSAGYPLRCDLEEA